MSSYAGSVNANREAANSTAGRARVSKKKKRFTLNMSNSAYRALLISVAIAIVFLVVITMSAYSARLQYENNSIQTDIDYLQAEIDSLNDQIAQETNVKNIEDIATSRLGMVYPSTANCITIGSEKKDSSGSLAEEIKKEAYN